MLLPIRHHESFTIGGFLIEGDHPTEYSLCRLAELREAEKIDIKTAYALLQDGPDALADDEAEKE